MVKIVTSLIKSKEKVKEISYEIRTKTVRTFTFNRSVVIPKIYEVYKIVYLLLITLSLVYMNVP